ncbi:MAG: Methionine sulfoxide reductase [Deltaproteobacteria bacterium]|nr:Methionine sulfoxide reductase [Deltaproteobacteria bacterium]
MNPTYYSLGDHSETIQIDYDPTKVSFEQLLELFWKEHNPESRPYSRQYMAAIFYHNEEQRQLAVKTKEREETRLKKRVYTEVLPLSRFYLAEDYHQKYSLRGIPELANEFVVVYPETQDFVNSTAVTRVNGYAGGNGTAAQLEAEINLLGLSPEGARKLREMVGRR